MIDRLHWLLSSRWGGGRFHVPADHLQWRGPRGTLGFTGNDAFDLNLYHDDGGDRVLIQIRREDARSLAWFILWRWWLCHEWFGLRRVVWYWALSRKVKAGHKP